jgi:transcriptional regulator with XRE-family HTH domain
LQSSTAITVAGVVRGRRNPLHHGLAERLKKTRAAKKITPRALSLAAGVGIGTARNIETEGAMPAIDTIELLARALAVEPCWLAFGVLGGVEGAEGDGFAHRAPAFVDEALEAFDGPGGHGEGGHFVDGEAAGFDEGAPAAVEAEVFVVALLAVEAGAQPGEEVGGATTKTSASTPAGAPSSKSAASPSTK